MSSFPHKTWRGRVVYDRKLHPFSDADIRRILKKYTVEQAVDPNIQILIKLLEDASDILLQAILTQVGLPFKAPLVRKLLEDFVGNILGRVGTVLHIRILSVSDDPQYNFDIRV